MIRKITFSLVLGTALTLGWSAAPRPHAAQAQASLGRIGEACARSLQVARDHIAAGETHIGSFPINWGTLPQAGRQTTQFCGCAQQAFRDADPSQPDILAITLFQSNRGELFTTNVLMPRTRMPGGLFGGGVGYYNQGSESAAVRRGYANFAEGLQQCGVATVGSDYSNNVFLAIHRLRGVRVLSGPSLM